MEWLAEDLISSGR